MPTTTPSAQRSVILSRVRGVRRYSAIKYAAPLQGQPKEALNAQGYPSRLKGFPITFHDSNLSPESLQELENRMESHFGPEVFTAEGLKRLAQASGAIPGSHVSFGLGHDGGVAVSHAHEIPGLLHGDRVFHRDANGNLVMKAQSQEAHHSIQGGGYKRFGETLKHLRDLGVKSVYTHGVGQLGGKANGYYTWPRFGFNANLKPEQYHALPAHIKDELSRRGKKDFHTLFSIPGNPHVLPGGELAPEHTLGGAGAWMRHGSAVHASFDLDPNSPHSKAFEGYAHGKSSSAGTPSGERGAGSPGTNREASGAGSPGEALQPDQPTTPERGAGMASSPARGSGTGEAPRRVSGTHAGRVNPHTPMSRKLDLILKYAARKSYVPVDPLIAHAAHAMDHPTDDAAMQAFADHLGETHGDHPVVQPFMDFVTRQEGGWDKVGKHIHPRDIRGFIARAPHSADTIAEAQQVNPAVNPVVAQQIPDMSRYTFAQDLGSRGWMNDRQGNPIPPEKIEGFGRAYGENLWHQATKKGTQNNMYLSFRSLKKKYTSAQVAKYIHDRLGPAGLVHLLVGLRYFHPDEIAKREAGGDIFAKPKFARKGDKPRRYAKVDGDVPAHHLIEGFPIEHALRHLANDPKNSPNVRHLSKTALTGVGANGQEIPGGPGPALFALHDALHEEDHPAKDWYKWMNAADKIGLDAHTKQAIEEESDRSKQGVPTDQRRYHHYSPEYHATQVSLGLTDPKGRGARDNYARSRREALARVRQRVSQLAPGVSQDDIHESILRHGRRAAMSFVKKYGDKSLQEKDRQDSIGPPNLKHPFDAAGIKAERYKRQDRFTENPSKTESVRKYAKPVAPTLPFEGEKLLSPVEQNIAAKGPTKAKSAKLLKSSVTGTPGTLPTVQELVTLAKAGGSTRGQYSHSYKVLSDFIGPKDTDLWVAANAVLSPQSAWEEHSRGAMRALRLWVEAGRPTDPKLVSKHVVEPLGTELNDKGTRLYSLYDGPKKAKLLDIFANPHKYYGGGGSIQSGGWGKITDFRGAFHNPGHAPLDTHQSKLTVPGFQELKKGINSLYSPSTKDTPEQLKTKAIKRREAHKELNALHKSLKAMAGATPVPHLLAHSIASSTGSNLPSVLLEAQKSIIGTPWKYKAYKSAIGQAAHELGWEPREVQEAVWTATVAIVAAKNYGIPAEDILKKLRHEDAFHAWNVGHILSNSEILSDLARLKPRGRSLAGFIKAAQKTPAEKGRIRPGDDATFVNVARRIPSVEQKGAWTPIVGSLEKRKASRQGEVKRYAAGTFLDSLRHMGASNNLVPIAKSIAAKLGAKQVHTQPALHDTARGSVPGVIQAIYGQVPPHAVHYLAGQVALANTRKSKNMAPPGVGVFHVRPNGSDNLYKFYQEGSGLDIRQKLDRLGITQRVLSPRKKGFDILVPDKGKRLTQAVQQYQQTHGVPMQVSQGHFQTIGSKDQGEARGKFRNEVVKGSQKG